MSAPTSRAAARWRFRLVYAVTAVAVIGAALAVLVIGLNLRDEDPAGAPARVVAPRADLVARGAYLARVGNCLGCHTAPGGAPGAGGRRIDTPFGAVEAPNLTPDAATGLGAWSEADFWRALHNGRSRDGRLLAPAFPYPEFTLVTRDDADALYAWLRQLPPVRHARAPGGLRFPFGTQAALAVWRAMYFRPGTYVPDAARDATWNRGAYLARGLGHCEACHASRNALGGLAGDTELDGGAMPGGRWFAPPLGGQPIARTRALLQAGVSADAAVIGPMADVVATSTRFLDDRDALAVADFLSTLPAAPAGAHPDPAPAAPAATMRAGAAIYRDHCARCHGDAGEGAPGAYPALRGSRAVALASPANVVQAILWGGFPPSTAANPRPYGMPPFVAALDKAQVAAVATYVRQSFGNRAAAVSPLDVLQVR